MMISELIGKLKMLENEFGEIEVMIGDADIAFRIGSINFIEEEDGAMRRFVAIEPNKI